LMRLGTNINPFQPATALATHEIFAWTRNPLYVGIFPVMCGVALILALDWLLLLVVPSYFILHFCVIKREEQYLECKFGADYRRYSERVPRYVRLLRKRTPLRADSDRHREI
jgi:protein-S-isoprenylcysteine O-methyltransferase Ste14